MKNNDKILAAFLVSVGMFSADIAVNYVRSLSSEQKSSLMPAAKAAKNIVLLANTNTLPVPGPVEEKPVDDAPAPTRLNA